MLITKDVKVIKSEDKKSYTSFPFDSFNFQFSDKDETTSYEPTTDGDPTKLSDGSVFVGSKPKNDVTADISDDAIAMLLLEAESYFEAVSQESWTNKKQEIIANPYSVYAVANDFNSATTPIQNAGKLYMLYLATAANNARIRLALDAANREKTVDLAAVRAAQVKQLIKGGNAKDERDALRQVARNEAMNLVEAAEEKGEDLTLKAAFLTIDWYQAYLKTLPVAA